MKQQVMEEGPEEASHEQRARKAQVSASKDWMTRSSMVERKRMEQLKTVARLNWTDALIWEKEAWPQSSFLFKDRDGDSTWRAIPRQGEREDSEFMYRLVEVDLMVGAIVY